MAFVKRFHLVAERHGLQVVVQGIAVLGKPSNDVSQFVKQYRNLCLWSVPFVRRNRQQTVAIGPSWHSSWIQLHDNRSAVEERPVGIQ